MERHHIENIFNEMIEDVKYIKLSGKGTLGKKGKYGLEIVY